MKKSHHILKQSVFTLGLCASIIALSACQTTQKVDDGAISTEAATDRQERISNALNRAAAQALKAGNTEQAISILEKSYQRNSQNASIATQYAYALRKVGQIDKADLVLQSFANKADASIATQQEYASIQLETGEYATAETFARKVIGREEKSSEAQHTLGIALDAQGKHEEAEKHFRTALDMWEGDPVPIMNNLALNLAAQEHIQEAVDILKKAKSIAPNRIEIERNLRIISTLNEAPKAFNAE
ncbi:MAG: tetratricopeptide repeat protein [Alphaproteobacteria bacterium]|nr:tetratricopeptide repeat protein [Alphaproteobacteria bacterium]